MPQQRPTMKPPSTTQAFMARDIEIDFQNKAAKRSSKPQIEIVVENENVADDEVADDLSQSPSHQLVDDDDLNLEDLLDKAV